jgi:tRNA/tmRNA/rRNA uracil-C5-methylase (TrmA/RlmC/RlmD family)
LDRNGRWEQQFGPPLGRIQEVILPHKEKLQVPLYFPPQVFRQANIDAFSKIIVRIRQWLKLFLQQQQPALPVDDENNARDLKEKDKKREKTSQKRSKRRLGHCLELYGGVGTIGLNLVDLFDSLESSDENPYNKDCFEASVANIRYKREALCSSRQLKITYESKSASDMVKGHRGMASLRRANVVIVDPPRKGLDADVIDALCLAQKEPHSVPSHQALVYVSCGFDAFQRDYNALVGPEKWKLDEAEGHILFPGSDAIEILAFFTRTA